MADETQSAAVSIDVLTLFPQWFSWLDDVRPIRNVTESGALAISVHDIRPYSPLKHNQVDDTPYGGGAGMVMRVDVVVAALEGIYGEPVESLRTKRRIVVLSPVGRQFDDALAEEWAGTTSEIGSAKPMTILCGRYEGFDHRIHQHVATEELSVGPYVLSGGEIPAMAIIDAVARKMPGALGNSASLTDETFSEGCGGGSEYPHYTKPAEFRGWMVPEILQSGNHGAIDAWRRSESALRSTKS